MLGNISVAAKVFSICKPCSSFEEKINDIEQLYTKLLALKVDAVPLLNDDLEPDIIASIIEFIDKKIEPQYVATFGNYTMRELLQGKTQRFFSKDKKDLFGFAEHKLYYSATESIVIKKDLYDALNLPLFKAYKGNYTPDNSTVYDPLDEYNLRLIDFQICIAMLKKAKADEARKRVPNLFNSLKQFANV